MELEAEVVNGDIVHNGFTREPIRCLQCKADLTKQGHEWTCSHHPTAPVCEECGENLRANGHKGTCSHSVMQGGSPMPAPASEVALLRGDVVAIRDELRWLRWYVPAPRFGPRRKQRESILRGGLDYLEQVARDISGRLDRLASREPADG